MNDLHKPIIVAGVAATVMKLTHAGEKVGVGLAVVGGYTATELAAYGGLLIAALSFIVNAAMNFYFKRQHLKLAEKMAAIGKLKVGADE